MGSRTSTGCSVSAGGSDWSVVAPEDSASEARATVEHLSNLKWTLPTANTLLLFLHGQQQPAFCHLAVLHAAGRCARWLLPA